MSVSDETHIGTSSALIAIVGRIPLPFGGVSVHLERLLGRLRSESIDYDFYDLGGKNRPAQQVYPGKNSFTWLLWFLLKCRCRYRLVHFHASNPYVLILTNILMAGSGVRLAYSLHGEGIFRWVTDDGPWPLRWILRRALQSADHVFAINPMVAKKLPDLGVDPDHISWMAAYLPPTEQELDPSHLSSEVCNFLKTHSHVIGMQAWFGSFLNGQDIYGMEQIVPLLKRLQTEFPRVGLCTAISGTHCPKHREHIYALRAEAGLIDDWMLLEGGGAAAVLFQRCAAFLRPTLTDGDSMSIRECLSFGIPVVASDAVVRPQRCILFPTGDIDVMASVVASALQTQETNYVNSDETDHAKCLVDYYQYVLNAE